MRKFVASGNARRSSFGRNYAIFIDCRYHGVAVHNETSTNTQWAILAFVVQRVRRSKMALNPQYEDLQEMTCTMRNWEARHHFTSRSMSRRLSRSLGPAADDTDQQHNHGPELLVTPVQEYLTNHRDDSPAGRGMLVRRTSSGSSARNREGAGISPAAAAAVPYSIPITDIMVVETYNARYGAPLHRLNITTISLGIFEFDCHNMNGHDILLAFLQACLAPERILDGSADCGPAAVNKTFSQSSSCLDVDGLTARHVQGRVNSETWPEKISRRVGKVVHSLQEISGAICDATCCQPAAEKRDSAPPRFRFEDLEFCEDDQEENVSPRPTSYPSRYPSTYRKETGDSDALGQFLPSGLSMESEPELEAAR
jgi:hypothetical protein